MNIIYKDTKTFTSDELQQLFLSVEWSSGHYPDKLVIAMQNYGSVFTAWDNDKLVGLISTMDDTIMTAYVHYLLVNPEYQGHGIGRTLVEMTKEYYKDYLRIVLTTHDKAEFYKHCGFEESDGIVLFITSLWT